MQIISCSPPDRALSLRNVLEATSQMLNSLQKLWTPSLIFTKLGIESALQFVLRNACPWERKVGDLSLFSAMLRIEYATRLMSMATYYVR